VYGGEGREGILPYLTSISGSDGKININTAPPLVLQVLVDGLSEELVELLVEYRKNPDNKEALEQPNWYKRVDGFPGDLSFDPKLVTVKSSFFACTITAGSNGLQQSGKGFIYRDPETQEQTLLSWKVE
jgi:type II secretory pathway component PulK